LSERIAHGPDDGPYDQTVDGPAEPRHRDDEPTTALEGLGGSTVALPIGLGLASAADAPAAAVDVPVRRRRRWLRWVALLLVLLVAAGAGAWWYLGFGPGAFTRVPDLTDATEASALATLHEHGLTGTRAEDFSDTIVAGNVIRTDPAANDTVPKKGTVTYVVSRGVDLVTIPDGLVGAMQDKAEAALKAADLTPAYGPEEYNDTAAKGSVLSATLPGDAGAAQAGAQVKRKTTVTLVLAKGPAPVTITSVVGATLDVATAQFAAAGLKISATEAFSDTVPAGQIIDQKPAASTAAHRGDTVAVTVSKGQEMLPVPSVIDMKADKAQATLETAGFVVRIANPHTGLNRVITQDPAGGPGKTAPRGSTVTLSLV